MSYHHLINIAHVKVPSNKCPAARSFSSTRFIFQFSNIYSSAPCLVATISLLANKRARTQQMFECANDTIFFYTANKCTLAQRQISR